MQHCLDFNIKENTHVEIFILYYMYSIDCTANKFSAATRGGLFSCSAAARAACVSTWLGELRAAGQATSGKLHASCPNFEPRAHARLTGLTNLT